LEDVALPLWQTCGPGKKLWEEEGRAGLKTKEKQGGDPKKTIVRGSKGTS